jgi:hypothetical protein
MYSEEALCRTLGVHGQWKPRRGGAKERGTGDDIPRRTGRRQLRLEKKDMGKTYRRRHGVGRFAGRTAPAGMSPLMLCFFFRGWLMLPFSYNLPVACSIAAPPQRARDGPAHLMDCFSVWLFSVSFIREFSLGGFFVGSRILVFCVFSGFEFYSDLNF